MDACKKGCNNGHIFLDGKWTRCECLVKRMNKKRLGVFNTDGIQGETPLKKHVERSLLIEGPIADIKRHVAGVLLDLIEEDKTFTSMDAYRLVEIFLDKDDEYQSTSDLSQYDLYIMLLGFGDIKNQRLPDIICQAIQRRELLGKPTWVILGLSLPQVQMKYNQEVYDSISSFKRISIK